MNISEIIKKAIDAIGELPRTAKKIINKLTKRPIKLSEEQHNILGQTGPENDNLGYIKVSNPKTFLDILIELGADENIVNNPMVAMKLREHCRNMFLLNGISGYQALEGGYYENDAEEIKTVIQRFGVLPSEVANERMGIRNNYKGIEIDPKTRTITIQDFLYHPGAVGQKVTKSNATTTFAMNEESNGGIATTIEEKDIYINEKGGLSNPKYYGHEKKEIKSTIDQEGILQTRKTITKTEVKGENSEEPTVKEVTIGEMRDPEYPLVVAKLSSNNEEITYSLISPSDVNEFTPLKMNVSNAENSQGVYEDVCFMTRDDAIKYCKQPKIRAKYSNCSNRNPITDKILKRAGIETPSYEQGG